MSRPRDGKCRFLDLGGEEQGATAVFVWLAEVRTDEVSLALPAAFWTGR